jgi:hypothetical protein
MHYLKLLSLCALAVLLSSSCKEKDETNPTGGNGVTAGLVRIHGIVADTAGVPLSDATFRVIYPITQGRAEADPQVPSAANFYTEQVLTTQCGGSIPLSDGTMVKIFWDANSNGPDDVDTQPPLCPGAPDCEPSSPGYVSINEIPINGASPEVGVPGTFYSMITFNTTGDVFDPSRFYGRIYCADGGVMYTSQVMLVPAGPSEQRMTFTCDTTCGGVPEIPQWALGQAYPNPALASASILYSLRDATTAVLTATLAGSNRMDTLVNLALPAGTRTASLSFAGRSNGLYRYALAAGGYSNHAAVLYNLTSLSLLQNQPALATSDNGGAYTFDCAASDVLSLRDASNHATGVATLDHVRVIVTRSGYQDKDTTLAITSGQNLELNLRLRP